MKEQNQIDSIKIKLRLAKNTDYFFEVFGASSHKYILGNPLSSVKLDEFETKYNLNLPFCYKQFLLQIGNGGLIYDNSVVGNSGAGPDYGIFELGHPFQFIVEPKLKYLENDSFFNEHMTEEEWIKIYDEMNENISDEEYDKLVAKAYSGILNIGYSGCSGYLGIILNGKNTGRVIETYEEIEYCPRLFEEANFLDWYENWLDRIISGKQIMSNDFISQSETEKYLVNEFITNIDDEYWQFKKLGYLRCFQTLSKNSIKLLWNKYQNTEQINQKICLLNFLTKFDYNNTKEEISKYSIEHPLVFLRNLHLYSTERTNEWISEIKSIKMKNQNNIEIVEYIKFVTEPDLKNYC
jgi:hypothetical protein